MSADSTWKQHKPSGVIVRPQSVSLEFAWKLLNNCNYKF